MAGTVVEKKNLPLGIAYQAGISGIIGEDFGTVFTTRKHHISIPLGLLRSTHTSNSGDLQGPQQLRESTAFS